MAVAAHSLSPLAGFNPLPSLRAACQRIVARWRAYRRRNRELAELFAFDERELRDLGLSRCDLMAIEHGSFRRD